MGQINDDLFINGALTLNSVNLPAGSVTAAAIQAAAGIEYTKTDHLYSKCWSQESATTATSVAFVVHTIRATGGGTIINFRAGNVVANIGGATVTVDLKKNGSTILSSVITLDNTKAAYSKTAAAGFTSTSLAAGDVLEVVTVATAGGGTLAKGVYAELTLVEKAA